MVSVLAPRLGFEISVSPFKGGVQISVGSDPCLSSVWTRARRVPRRWYNAHPGADEPTRFADPTQRRRANVSPTCYTVREQAGNLAGLANLSLEVPVQKRINWDGLTPQEAQERAGLKFGDRGMHTSRTMMSAELLEVIPKLESRDTYPHAIVQENALGKATASNRLP